MSRNSKSIHPGRILVLSWLFLFMASYMINAQQAGPLSRDELNSELRKALEQNDESAAKAIIKGNRLLIKPFVDALNRESIIYDLKGNSNASDKVRLLSKKSADYFESIFGEKSLSIAVNYLTVWNIDQKRKKLIADSLYNEGTRYRNSNESQKALDIFNRVLELYTGIGDERGESEVLGGFGALYFNNLQDFQKAFEYYQKALEKREKVNDVVLVGNTLSSIGSVYHDYFKDYHKALDYLLRAAKIRNEIGDKVNLGRTIHVMASAFQKTGQPDSALFYFGKSFELNSMAGDKLRMAQAKLHSGEILNNLGKYTDALDFLEISLELFKEAGLRDGEGDVLNQIGFVYANIGEYEKAIEKISEAADIMKETGNMDGLAGVYNHFGIVLMEAGRYEKALEYLLKSLETYEKIGNQSDMIPVIGNIGNVYKYMADYKKAEDYHKRGLKICHDTDSKLEEVHYLLNLANDQLLQGKLEEARANYEEAELISKPFNNPDLNWRIVAGLAEYNERSGSYENAVTLNDSALKILEIMRGTLETREQKSSYMASERYVYEDIINLLASLHLKYPLNGYDKLAFGYAEKSKSRVLLDLLSESRTGQTVSRPVTLDEARLLSPDRTTVILDYFVGDSSSCLWVITNSRYSMIRLPGLSFLRQRIETIRFSILDPKQSVSEFFLNAGTILYNELIKPAENYLSKRSNLVIIPDGILNYLPFEVLLTEKMTSGKESTYSEAPFLVRKYPVSYVQSASVLKTLLEKENLSEHKNVRLKNILAYGDPLYDDSLLNRQLKYPRLEFSGKEIENITSFFSSGSADVCLREKATEENFKATSGLEKYSYLHFATHGLIDENKPDLSSIVLTTSRDSGEDGLLQATEIFNMKFNADLVVLSACQTGLGKLVRGEGIVGLTRAFMYAGTPSVVVSLWSVSDMSTASLMGEFYKNLIKYKLGKSAALRKAQLTLMSDAKYAHPFYWAPFILIGDWR